MSLYKKEVSSHCKLEKGGCVTLLTLAAMAITMGAVNQAMAQELGQQAQWGEHGNRNDDHAWRFWGGNLEDTHGSAFEHRINVENVSQLAQK